MTESEIVPTEVAHALKSVTRALDDLAEIEANSIKGDREEVSGTVCYDPDTDLAEVEIIQSKNDSLINRPMLTIDKIDDLCPSGQLTTLWHTHGTSLHSFSDLDRYSSGDIAAAGNRIGLCALGIDGIQCHFAFLSIPQVANIKWGMRLEEKIEPFAEHTHIVDDLICDGELNCEIRLWSEGMAKKPLGKFDGVNCLEGGVFSASSDGGLVVSAHRQLKCYEITSEDGFRSLNCYERRDS